MVVPVVLWMSLWLTSYKIDATTRVQTWTRLIALHITLIPMRKV